MTTIAEIDLSLATFVGIHNALGLRPVLTHGTKTLQERWTSQIASGRSLAGFALSEPGAGSNPTRLETVAERDASGWRVTGTKSWIGNAAWADLLTVICRTVEDDATTGFTAFAVPLDRRGITHGPEVLTMGVRSVVQSEIRFDGVQVDDSHILGVPGQGLPVAHDIVAFGRLGIAAMAVGGMRRALWYAQQYGGRRRIATGRLLDNGATQERVDAWLNAHDGTQAMVEALTERVDRGLSTSHEETAAIKVVATERLWHVVDGVMQMLGARGYAENSGLPQLLRDARLFRIFEGPTEVLESYLGTRAVRRGEAATPELSAAIRGAQTMLEGDPGAREAILNRLGRAVAEDYAHQATLTRGGMDATRWSQEQLRRTCDAVLWPVAGSAHITQRRLKQIAERVPARPDFAGADHGLDTLLQADSGAQSQVSPVSRHTPLVTGEPEALQPTVAASTRIMNEDRLVHLILDQTAKVANLPRAALNPHAPFSDTGLDSMDAVGLTAELAEITGTHLDVVAVYDNPTPAALASYIAAHQSVSPDHDHSARLLDELRRELREH